MIFCSLFNLFEIILSFHLATKVVLHRWTHKKLEDQIPWTHKKLRSNSNWSLLLAKNARCHCSYLIYISILRIDLDDSHSIWRWHKMMMVVSWIIEIMIIDQVYFNFHSCVNYLWWCIFSFYFLRTRWGYMVFHAQPYYLMHSIYDSRRSTTLCVLLLLLFLSVKPLRLFSEKLSNSRCLVIYWLHPCQTH